jgi:uncharacterized protein YjiS (DUF1127 family)
MSLPEATVISTLERATSERPMTGEQYIESIRDGREVYLYGDRVKDVTTHPAFRNSVRMTARLYDALHDPKSREVLTCATDTGNRGWTMRFFRSARSAKDLAADRDASGAGLRTSQAAAGGGAAIIPALAKAVIAAAGKWWRAYNIRRARIAAVRELHALDDRMLRDIGVSRSEIERVVVHGRDAPQFHSASRSPSTPHFEFRRC